MGIFFGTMLGLTIIAVLFFLAYTYEDIVIPCIAFGVGAFFIYCGILSKAYLMCFIMAGFGILCGIIAIKDKLPLQKRNHKSNSDNNKEDK